jgi:hypothetical protein
VGGRAMIRLSEAERYIWCRSSRVAVAFQFIMSTNNNNIPSNNPMNNSISGARMVDLCPEDKSKIAKLLLSVNNLKSEEHDLQQQLAQYKAQNHEIITHNNGLKTKFLKSLQLLNSYQIKMKSFQQKLNKSKDQDNSSAANVSNNDRNANIAESSLNMSLSMPNGRLLSVASDLSSAALLSSMHLTHRKSIDQSGALTQPQSNIEMSEEEEKANVDSTISPALLHIHKLLAIQSNQAIPSAQTILAKNKAFIPHKLKLKPNNKPSSKLTTNSIQQQTASILELNSNDISRVSEVSSPALSCISKHSVASNVTNTTTTECNPILAQHNNINNTNITQHKLDEQPPHNPIDLLPVAVKEDKSGTPRGASKQPTDEANEMLQQQPALTNVSQAVDSCTQTSAINSSLPSSNASSSSSHSDTDYLQLLNCQLSVLYDKLTGKENYENAHYNQKGKTRKERDVLSMYKLTQPKLSNPHNPTIIKANKSIALNLHSNKAEKGKIAVAQPTRAHGRNLAVLTRPTYNSTAKISPKKQSNAQLNKKKPLNTRPIHTNPSPHSPFKYSSILPSSSLPLQADLDSDFALIAALNSKDNFNFDSFYTISNTGKPTAASTNSNLSNQLDESWLNMLEAIEKHIE